MSVARLAALVSRAAAPPGRVAHEAAIPVLDAPAAVDAAMLQAGLATMSRAAEVRRAAAPALPAARPVRQADPVTVTLTTRLAAPGAAPVTVPRDATPAPGPGQAPQMPDPIVMPAVTAPGPGLRVSPTGAEIDPAVPIATGEGAVTQPARAVMAAVLPAATRSIAVPAPVPAEPASDVAPPAPSITNDPLLPGVRTPGAVPGLPVAADAAGVVAGPAVPAIAIGTVEVVMAPLARAPAPPPRPAPDRGFSRYAAMRTGRDRAW